MNKFIPLLSLLASFCIAHPGLAQGTIQNPGFESATLIPIPGDPYGRVQFSAAFPGWVGFVGTVQETSALYNSTFLDSSGISIIDHGWSNPFGGPGGVIQGNYTAILQAGVALGTFQPADTAIAQVASVPSDAQSLQFRAYRQMNPSASFAVTLDGQTLSLSPISLGPNYTLYGADIHAWAGQTAELRFTVFADRPHMSNEYLFLDSILYSTEAVPEPRSLFLLTLIGFSLGRRFVQRGES